MRTAELSEPWHFSSDERPPRLYFPLCLQPAERDGTEGVMEEAESRMCPSRMLTTSLSLTGHFSSGGLVHIYVCVCVCAGFSPSQLFPIYQAL